MRHQFHDAFDGEGLDESRWLPHYLPHWSSRAAVRGDVRGAGLRAEAEHPARPRALVRRHPRQAVAGVGGPVGCFSGPVGSTVGQQPFADDQVVREEQPAWWGWTPEHGRIEVRARMELSETSMASVWMIGLEDSPERCGEICLFEVFGNTIAADGASADVGTGCTRSGTPSLVEEFSAEPQHIDVRAASLVRRRVAPRRHRLPARRAGGAPLVAVTPLSDADDDRRVRLPRARVGADARARAGRRRRTRRNAAVTR